MKTDRHFFSAMTMYFLIVCCFGFIPSTADPNMKWPLSTVLHGIITSMWMILLVVQTSLIRTSNVKLHKTLGMAGFLLVLLMIPSAYFLARHIVLVGSREIGLGGMDFTSIVLICIILTIGLLLRKKPNTHKRLMLLGSMWFLGAAWARIFRRFFMYESSAVLNIGIVLVPVILILVYDLFTRRKVFVITILVPILFLFAVLSTTKFWQTPDGNALLTKVFQLK